MKEKVIHLRDKRLPRVPVHFLLSKRGRRLTADPAEVTCGTCRRMIERGEKIQGAGQ